jgi:hypothetical protein
MSGLATVADAPVSMVTRQGFSCTQPSAIRLPLAHPASTLTVKRGGVIDDSDNPLLVLGSWPTSSGGLCPHNQQTGRSLCRRSGGVGGLFLISPLLILSLLVFHSVFPNTLSVLLLASQFLPCPMSKLLFPMGM